MSKYIEVAFGVFMIIILACTAILAVVGTFHILFIGGLS